LAPCTPPTASNLPRIELHVWHTGSQAHTIELIDQTCFPAGYIHAVLPIPSPDAGRFTSRNGGEGTTEQILVIDQARQEKQREKLLLLLKVSEGG
jgi:hypothetical protein